MASLEQLVYQLPKQGKGADLSTLHSLSRQKRAATSRYGRVSSPISKYHGSEGVGDFAAASIQNAASGGDTIPARPQPAPFVPDVPVSNVPAFSASDTGEANANQVNTLADLASQQLGNQVAANTLGRGIKGVAQMGQMAYNLNAPAQAALEATPQAFTLAALNPMGAVKGALEAALIGSPAISDIQSAINASGVADTSTTPLGTPMGTATANAQTAAISNAPTTLGGLISNAIKGGPSASEIGEAAVTAEQQGLSQALGVTRGSDDPVAAALYSEVNPQAPKAPVMENMLAQSLSQKAVPQPFEPMSIAALTGSPEPEMGFEPMTIGFGAEGAPEMGFEPMSINIEAAAAAAGQGAPSPGVAPGGSLGPAGTPGEAGLGAGPGGDSGTVICTELHRQGLMTDYIYKADSEFGETLDEDTRRGYHLWGKPIAKAMSKSALLTQIVRPLAMEWAYEMANRQGSLSRKSWIGSAMLYVGVPVCRMVGKIIKNGIIPIRNITQE